MGLEVENSLDGIRKAIKLGVDAVEVDVRMQNSVVVLAHDKTRSEKIYCSLRLALEEINGKVPINIEIKEKSVVKHLKKHIDNYEGKVIFSSMRFSTLQEVMELFPDHEIAVVERWSGVKGVAEAALLKVKRIHLNNKFIWRSLVRSIIDQGFDVYVYTVNDEERARQLKNWGVKGIFTDYPNKFKQVK